MLLDFFYKLRDGALPVSITEYLALLEAMQAGAASMDVNDFYCLARTCLVKDESRYDRFDQIFAAYFDGVQSVLTGLEGDIPPEWLQRQAELYLSEEDRAKLESLGGWDKLMETLKQRLAEQEGRHEGGSKWIGTAGTSPFGAFGANPEGIRIGQGKSRNGSAVKVWERREFADLDGSRELGTRNIKLALRRLRRFAREGAEDELDMDDTIYSTARNGGLLDIKMVPERRNAIKVLLFLDVGGSMDAYVRTCEELFSAARMEFKHLEYFYFHNFLYEKVWKDNFRRHSQFTPTIEVMRKFSRDYKVIFVGDATMSPYEIAQPGGSIEHWNEESGAVWITRLLNTFPHSIWLNPEPEQGWDYVPSIGMTRELVQDRMYPLTLDGLDRGMRALRESKLPTPL